MCRRADPSAPEACVATLVRVSARRPRDAGRAGVPTRPARAPGRAGGRPARQQGRARCVCVLVVAAARRREGLGGTHPATDATGQCGLAPPSHASPEDGAPRGRHGVGTKHTRGVEAAGRAKAVRSGAYLPHAFSKIFEEICQPQGKNKSRKK